jgi:CBS-domain-containing membrane protein
VAQAETLMAFIDQQFKDNKRRYLVQCGLATACVLVILLVLDPLTDTTTIAALGASSFIAFTMPHKRASRPRLMIGGYVIGMVMGYLCYRLLTMPALIALDFVQRYGEVIFGALAVGSSIFLMVITDSEHPPAAGLALAFVITGTSVGTVAVVTLGIVSLSLTKTLLGPLLSDLA